jgi:predicted nucleotidyltransferase
MHTLTEPQARRQSAQEVGMQRRQDAVRLLTQQIIEAVHPLRIVLFGSAVRDEDHAGSDIDLLIVMPDGTHRRHTAQRLYRTISGVSLPYDLIVATPFDLERHRDNPGLIYHSITREGRTLYVAPTA